MVGAHKKASLFVAHASSAEKGVKEGKLFMPHMVKRNSAFFTQLRYRFVTETYKYRLKNRKNIKP